MPDTARRPAWAEMKQHYPDSSIATADLYDRMIGGKFKGLYKQAAYQNTCAVRMSYGLNRSGLKLGQAPSSGGSVRGGDGHTYWIRVTDLKKELETRFKGADEALELKIIPNTLIGDNDGLNQVFQERVMQAQDFLDTKLAAKSGIVVFEVRGWGDASGHFTLWDSGSKRLAYADGHDSPSDNNYYFWLTQLAGDPDKPKLVQTARVKFWELE
jgi:hypothetical protein